MTATAYVLVGLAYALANGLQNRAMVRQAVRCVAAREGRTAGFVYLMIGVLFWTVFWPVGVVCDLLDRTRGGGRA